MMFRLLHRAWKTVRRFVVTNDSLSLLAVLREFIDQRFFGCGLQEFFGNRRDTLSGILNGLDTSSFDPQTDSVIEKKFSADDLSARKRNKTALQERLALPVLPDVPLLGMVSRMDEAKGIDIALKGLKMLGPILTLVLGGMIAFVIWAVLGPVYDILGKLKF
jgi:glycogen synthase